MTINALMLSASKEGNTPYLSHALPFIQPLTTTAKHWLFIPFAGVSLNYDDYLERVKQGLGSLDIDIGSIHQFGDPHQALAQADGIMVGGGNTFHLLHELYRYDLVDTIKQAVASGKPYIGWSAGSNITGQSIRTTNDMPIIEPPSFNALNILPFQLNPHYTNYVQAGHNGETRAQRLKEFTCVAPDTPVVGIQEGSALWRRGDTLTLMGTKEAFLFKGELQEIPLPAGCDLSHLL
ncbi:MAG: dipeptidase PepE [Shewanella sp.]|nr:dipeptidase PepE [Shewanella sp.]